MKKLTLAFLLCLSITAFTQTTDQALNTRIQEYLAYNKALNFEKLMDYIHPKLFTIAPREAILQVFEQTFKSKEMQFTFDSMAVATVTPVFKFGGAEYRRVNYFAQMTIAMNKDSMDLSNPEAAGIMRKAFAAGFPGKKVTMNVAKNAIVVSGTDVMFAIKDATVSDWMFLGYDRSKAELNRRLYPKPVRTHFKLQ